MGEGRSTAWYDLSQRGMKQYLRKAGWVDEMKHGISSYWFWRFHIRIATKSYWEICYKEPRTSPPMTREDIDKLYRDICGEGIDSV